MGFRKLGDSLFSMGVAQRFGLGKRSTAGGVTYEIPSYANAGGTGDRTALITVTTNNLDIVGSVTEFVNGLYVDSLYWGSGDNTGKYYRFKFTHKVLITETKLFQDRTNNHGNFKWQVSDDNGSNWTDATTDFVWSGSLVGAVDTSLSANTTGHEDYRLIGTGGNFSGSPYIREMEFKIGNINP